MLGSIILTTKLLSIEAKDLKTKNNKTKVSTKPFEDIQSNKDSTTNNHIN